MPSIQGWEWVIILVIVLLVFGVGRITKIGSELGQGIRAFRQGLKEEDKNTEETVENSEVG